MKELQPDHLREKRGWGKKMLATPPGKSHEDAIVYKVLWQYSLDCRRVKKKFEAEFSFRVEKKLLPLFADQAESHAFALCYIHVGFNDSGGTS